MPGEKQQKRNLEQAICHSSTHRRLLLWQPPMNSSSLVPHIDGLAQDCSNSSALAMELLQSCAKPSIYASVNWVSIGSGNGLSPVPRQAITWTNGNLLSIGPLGTNFSKIRIEIQNFHSWKCIWKHSLEKKPRPFCPRGDELNQQQSSQHVPFSVFVQVGYWNVIQSNVNTLLYIDR